MIDAPQQYRSPLLYLAYHLLGSMDAAEDVLQDVSVEWLRMDHQPIDSPQAYLNRMVLHRSLDQLRRLQRERAQYPGPWLPEPVVDPPWEPEQQSLSLAILHLLERLDPRERAVYLLRECFDWDYEAIAALMQLQVKNCRQIKARAKQHLQRSPAPQKVSPAQLAALTEAFLRASQQSDFEPLRKLFCEEMVLYGDGGGKVLAARKPVYGAENCLRFLVGLQKHLTTSMRWEGLSLNGEWALALWEGPRLDSLMWFAWSEAGILSWYSLRNPDKLARLAAQLG